MFTLSANPSAAVSASALLAWIWLKVIPWHVAPYFLARYLEPPPIPHPTSTICLGLILGSSAKQNKEVFTLYNRSIGHRSEKSLGAGVSNSPLGFEPWWPQFLWRRLWCSWRLLVRLVTEWPPFSLVRWLYKSFRASKPNGLTNCEKNDECLRKTSYPYMKWLLLSFFLCFFWLSWSTIFSLFNILQSL